MFAGIIDRSHGTPWPATSMSTARWMLLPPTTVEIHRLHATQNGVYLRPLLGPRATSHSGDPLPHVIAHQGALYLEDGHHRVLRAALKGHRDIAVRLLEIP